MDKFATVKRESPASDHTRFPFGSLVSYSADDEGNPIMLMDNLSVQAENVAHDCAVRQVADCALDPAATLT